MRSIQEKKVVTGRCGCESEMKRSAVGPRSDMPYRGTPWANRSWK